MRVPYRLYLVQTFIRMHSTKKVNPHKISQENLNISCQELTEYLLGKLLVRKFDGKILKGRIVETECYAGGEDKGSVSFGGRRTPKIEPLYMPVGTSFVYMTYGMYYCLNISSIEPGGAVLLRALEPTEGLETMRKYRSAKRLKDAKDFKDTELCNGPSKLCMAMNINKDNGNMLNMCESEELWLEVDPEFDDTDLQIVRTSRVVNQATVGEWAKQPLRFYILNNPHVSKRDKKAENELLVE